PDRLAGRIGTELRNQGARGFEDGQLRTNHCRSLPSSTPFAPHHGDRVPAGLPVGGTVSSAQRHGGPPVRATKTGPPASWPRTRSDQAPRRGSAGGLPPTFHRITRDEESRTAKTAAIPAACFRPACSATGFASVSASRAACAWSATTT